MVQTMQQSQLLPVQEAQQVLGLGEHMVPDLAAIARASLVQMNVIFQRTDTRELVFRGDASRE